MSEELSKTFYYISSGLHSSFDVTAFLDEINKRTHGWSDQKLENEYMTFKLELLDKDYKKKHKTRRIRLKLLSTEIISKLSKFKELEKKYETMKRKLNKREEEVKKLDKEIMKVQMDNIFLADLSEEEKRKEMDEFFTDISEEPIQGMEMDEFFSKQQRKKK